MLTVSAPLIDEAPGLLAFASELADPLDKPNNLLAK